MQHAKTIASKFSDWLMDRYLDNISERYSRPVYSDHSLMDRAEKFKEKLFVFEDAFCEMLEKRLEQKAEVVYSNTPFVSEFDSEFCESVECLSYNVLGTGVIDILQNKIKFVLSATKDSARLTQEFYNDGVKQTNEIANIFAMQESFETTK